MAQVGDFVYKATKIETPRKPNGKMVISLFNRQYLVEFIDTKTRVRYITAGREITNDGGITLSPRYNSDGSIMLATPEEIEEYREG